ncbi:MAG: hypothetical protein ABL901_17095 [Hyphomicrobiaceae bacterium]
MNRAVLILASLICFVWALVFVSVQSAHAGTNNGGFQKLWDETTAALTTNPNKKAAAKQKPTVKQKADEEPRKIKLRKKKRVGSGTPPERVKGQDQRQSERAVCRSQCNLQRMGCDQGNNSFQNRTDQLRAAQSSCFLAVQSCLSRC